MERALRAMAEKIPFQREDLDVPKPGKREQLKEFGDLLLHHHHQENDTDKYSIDAFDNDEMCEYVTCVNGFSSTHCKASDVLMFGPVLEAEKQFMEAAKMNDVEGMRMVGRGLNFNAKNVVCSIQQAHEICAIL